MKAYFFIDGIRQLASELNGLENIYLGIRPFGFHAGNMLPHVIYPKLLCQELIKNGKTPRFNIFFFINDWEQNQLAGPDTKKYIFNIFPADTTFQYTMSFNNPSRGGKFLPV